jgi:hypothetical protein
MATVWRYIVVNVDASFEALTSAQRLLPPDNDRQAPQSATDKAGNR